MKLEKKLFVDRRLERRRDFLRVLSCKNREGKKGSRGGGEQRGGRE
jgi:hypothetical protein